MGVCQNATVRRLLPVECERLMGFPITHASRGKANRKKNARTHRVIKSAVTVCAST